jgi:hypothetical protein
MVGFEVRRGLLGEEQEALVSAGICSTYTDRSVRENAGCREWKPGRQFEPG